MQCIGDEVKISSDIRAVRLHGVISQSPKRDHLFITFKKIHSKPPENVNSNKNRRKRRRPREKKRFKIVEVFDT